MADAVAVPDCTGVVADFRTTTGKSLELELDDGPDGWVGVRVSVDQVVTGTFGARYPGGDVERLVQLTNDLTAGFLGDAVGARWWPMCPDHGTHPMHAAIDAAHQAVWQCPGGRVVAKIGELNT